MQTFSDFLLTEAYDRDKVWDGVKDRVIKRAHAAREAGGGPEITVEPGSPTKPHDGAAFYKPTSPSITYRWNDTHHIADSLRLASGSVNTRSSFTPEENADIAKGHFMDAVEQAAPNDKAKPKIAQLFADGGIKKFEDIGGQAAPLFKDYHALLKTGKLQGEETSGYDVGSKMFKSMQDYKAVIDKHAVATDGPKPIDSLEEGEDYRVVHDNEHGTAYESLSQKGATKLGIDPHTGRKANWCTMVDGSDGVHGGSYWEEYHEQGPVIAIHPKKPEHPGEMHQYHMQSAQYMDEGDNAVRSHYDGSQLRHMSDRYGEDMMNAVKNYSVEGGLDRVFQYHGHEALDDFREKLPDLDRDARDAYRDKLKDNKTIEPEQHERLMFALRDQSKSLPDHFEEHGHPEHDETISDAVNELYGAPNSRELKSVLSIPNLTPSHLSKVADYVQNSRWFPSEGDIYHRQVMNHPLYPKLGEEQRINFEGLANRRHKAWEGRMKELRDVGDDAAEANERATMDQQRKAWGGEQKELPKTESVLPDFDLFLEAKYDRDALWDKYKGAITVRAHTAISQDGAGWHMSLPVGAETSLQTGTVKRYNSETGMTSAYRWHDPAEPMKALRQASVPDDHEDKHGRGAQHYNVEHGSEYAKKSIMDAVEDAAPRDKAREKILKLFATGGISRFEDIGSQAKETFGNYHQLLKNGHLQGKETAGYDASDSNKDFENLGQYRTLVDKYASKLPVKKPTDGLVEGHDYTTVHDDENVTAYHIHTLKAAKALAHCPTTGKKAAWCTAIGNPNDDSTWFHKYDEDGPVIAIHPKLAKRPGELYQYHMASDQAMDEHDDDISDKHHDEAWTAYSAEDDDDYGDHAPSRESHESVLNGRFRFSGASWSSSRRGHEAGLGDKLLHYSTMHEMHKDPNSLLTSWAYGTDPIRKGLWHANYQGIQDKMSPGLRQAFDFHFTHWGSERGMNWDKNLPANHSPGANWVNSQRTLSDETRTSIANSNNTAAKNAMLKHPDAQDMSDRHLGDIGQTSDYHVNSFTVPEIHEHLKHLNDIKEHPKYAGLSDDLKKHMAIDNRIAVAHRELAKRATLKDDRPGSAYRGEFIESFSDFLAEAKYDRDALWDKYKPQLVSRAHVAYDQLGVGAKIFTPGEDTSADLQPNTRDETGKITGMYNWHDTHNTMQQLRMGSFVGANPQRAEEHKKVFGVDVTQDEYHNSAKDQIMDAVEDAAPRDKAREKILKMFASGGISRFEDIGSQAKEVFAGYHQLLKNGHLQGLDTMGYDVGYKGTQQTLPNGDIRTHNFDSLHPYRALINQHADKMPAKDFKAGLKEGEDYKIVHDDEKVTAYHIMSQKAAVALAHDPHTGRKAAWCTAIDGDGGGGQSWWANYNKDGPVIAIHPKKPTRSGEMYQYHKSSGQTMDEHDEDISKPEDYGHSYDEDEEHEAHEDVLNRRFSFRGSGFGMRHTMKGEDRGLGDKLKNYSLDDTLINHPESVISSSPRGSHMAELADRWHDTWDHEDKRFSADQNLAYEFKFTHGSNGNSRLGTGGPWVANASKIGPLLKRAIHSSGDINATTEMYKHKNVDITNDDLINTSNRHIGSMAAPGRVSGWPPIYLEQGKRLLDAVGSHPAFQALSPESSMRQNHADATKYVNNEIELQKLKDNPASIKEEVVVTNTASAMGVGGRQAIAGLDDDGATNPIVRKRKVIETVLRGILSGYK